MNRVTESCGGRVTVTVKAQAACSPAASAAVQLTAVTPGRNTEPDAGAHDVWTGAVPPCAVGSGQEIDTGWFWIERPDCAGGHVTLSAGAVVTLTLNEQLAR